MRETPIVLLNWPGAYGEDYVGSIGTYFVVCDRVTDHVLVLTYCFILMF